MSEEEAVQILKKAASDLGEHFDNIQIHASWMSLNGDGYTKAYHTGIGDWYARQGLAHAFINEDQAKEIGRAVQQAGEEE